MKKTPRRVPFQNIELIQFASTSVVGYLNPGLLRKEVIQPHLPVQLPCYDLTPVTSHTLNTNRIGAVLRLWVQLAPMV